VVTNTISQLNPQNLINIWILKSVPESVDCNL
jgi:hypothetical protein